MSSFEWTKPGCVHHFNHLNVGRMDPQSWNKPEETIPPLFQRVEYGEDGKVKSTAPIGWDAGQGVVVCHPFDGNNLPDGVSVAQAVAERRARYAELQRNKPFVASVYRALYYEGDNPIAPTYWGVTCFRRSFAIPFIASGLEKPEGFVVPLEVRDYASPIDSLLVTLRENDVSQKTGYSEPGYVHIATELLRKGYREVEIGRATGLLGRRSTLQKIVRIARLANLHPALKIVERISLDKGEFSQKDGNRVTLVYRPMG
jgi:hypothetical protein